MKVMTCQPSMYDVSTLDVNREKIQKKDSFKNNTAIRKSSSTYQDLPLDGHREELHSTKEH
jgi:hypothetical protein